MLRSALFELATVAENGGLHTDLEGQRVRIECPFEIREHGPIAFIHAWCCDWVKNAQPVVQPTHKYAAALMATSVPRIEIRPPWPVFYLAVPDGLAHLDDEGTARQVEGILVYAEHDHWTYMAHTSTVEYTRMFYPREQLCDEDVVAPALWDGRILPSTTTDERAVLCLDRLLLNACLAMSDPRNVRQIGKAHATRTRGQARIFELTRPVRVDCRAEIKRYIGEGVPMSAKSWLVRGHWRNQPHGPERSQRRMQWIEPFWKGEGPIAVREHQLK